MIKNIILATVTLAVLALILGGIYFSVSKPLKVRDYVKELEDTGWTITKMENPYDTNLANNMNSINNFISDIGLSEYKYHTKDGKILSVTKGFLFGYNKQDFGVKYRKISNRCFVVWSENAASALFNLVHAQLHHCIAEKEGNVMITLSSRQDEVIGAIAKLTESEFLKAYHENNAASLGRPMRLTWRKGEM